MGMNFLPSIWRKRPFWLAILALSVPEDAPNPATSVLIYRGLTERWFSKRVVLADVPPERKPERGYIRMFPRNENRNEGTFACSPGTKTATRLHSDVPRAHSPKPPLYETALLSPSEFRMSQDLPHWAALQWKSQWQVLFQQMLFSPAHHLTYHRQASMNKQ